MDIAHPPVKPWSKANKDYLQELIDLGKVDIGRSIASAQNTSATAMRQTFVATFEVTPDRVSSRTRLVVPVNEEEV
mgnify:CR=1 FL=1